VSCIQILYVTCVSSFCNVCINAFAWHRFTKTWRVQNIGDESWPLGCCLRFSGGDRLCAADRIPVEPVSPGCTIDLSVDMVSPEQPGIYESKWRMSTFSGSYFGGLFFLTLNDECSVSTEGVRGNKVLTKWEQCDSDISSIIKCTVVHRQWKPVTMLKIKSNSLVIKYVMLISYEYHILWEGFQIS